MDKWYKCEVFLAHLVYNTTKSIHCSWAEIRTRVKCAYNRMYNTRGKVVEVQSLAESIQGFQSTSMKNSDCCSQLRQRGKRGLLVRVPDLNAVDPGSSPALTTSWICLRVNPRVKSTVNSQQVCLQPAGILSVFYIIRIFH